MEIRAAVTLLVLLTSGCSAQQMGEQENARLEPDDEPVFYALATAKTAAIRVIDESKQRCWEWTGGFLGSFPDLQGENFRKFGIDPVGENEDPDIIVVVNPKGTRDDQSLCVIELHLSFQLHDVTLVNEALPTGSEISGMIGGSISRSRGNTSEINEWIWLQTQQFITAIAVGRLNARTAIANSGFQWRITSIRNPKISSRDMLQRYIDLCGLRGRGSTVRNGVLFVNISFVQCMRDRGFEIHYDDEFDVRGCKWVESASDSAGYDGELRCRTSL